MGDTLVHGREELPPGAAEFLQADNPRISELRALYSGHPAHDLSVWSDNRLRDQIDLAYFRGDNQFLFQGRGSSELTYRLSYDVARQVDELGLFELLTEDESFGALTYDIDGVVVSRDLIDSVLELNFMSKTFGEETLRNARLLDIGAGYGRLAHRLLDWSPDAHVTATDAVPVSTFICEYYLQTYLEADRAEVVPLHEAEATIRSGDFDIATNIHSWGEATLSSVRWWLEQLAAGGIDKLFVVHHSDTLSALSHGLKPEPLIPALEDFGFSLESCSPKYPDELAQRLGLFPCFYFVFTR
jgi:SAM-dependent methyltransferase